MILHSHSPWLKEALARALVAMAVSQSCKRQCWAKRSAATLSRRLRQDRQRADLFGCAGQALAQLPVHEIASPAHSRLVQHMVDYGAAKLDHQALDSFNGVH